MRERGVLVVLAVALPIVGVIVGVALRVVSRTPERRALGGLMVLISCGVAAAVLATVVLLTAFGD